MRRLTATALTLGSLVAGLGAITDPAYAAAPRKWSAPNRYGSIAASGTYVRTGNKVTYKGTLKDFAKNGWTACVQFMSTETNDDSRWDRFKITVDRPHGKYYYFDGKAAVAISGSSPNTGHLYVRECRRHKQTGGWGYGPYRKLY